MNSRMNFRILIVFSTFSIIVYIGSECSHGNIFIGHPMKKNQYVNLQRQRRIKDRCRQYPPSKSLEELDAYQLQNILIDDKHKLLYCYVPKVACTNWKRILMILTGKWNGTDPSSIPAFLPHYPGTFRNLSSVSQEERDYMLENYEKMLFVRNPFERLLSAYRSKLEGNLYDDKFFLSSYERKSPFPDNSSNEIIEPWGREISFKELVLFLLGIPDKGIISLNDEHWRPISKLCHPCLIQYTLVGKFETLLDDALLALHTINASHIKFPAISFSDTTEKLPKYFAQLDFLLVNKLYKVYQRDFQIFDYNLKNVLDLDVRI